MKKVTKLEALRVRMFWRLDSAARQYQAARRDFEKARTRDDGNWVSASDRGFAHGRMLTLDSEVEQLADWLEVAVPVVFIEGRILVGGSSPIANAARCAQWEWQEQRRKASVAARLSLLTLPPEDFIGRYAERVLFTQEVRA